jgi:hypothetical protein
MDLRTKEVIDKTWKIKADAALILTQGPIDQFMTDTGRKRIVGSWITAVRSAIQDQTTATRAQSIK